MNKGYVNRILPFSSVDGPGNRTAIFLQGCNFNCLYCHNPETINHCNHCQVCVTHCPYGALSLEAEQRVSWNATLCQQCDQCLKVCPRTSSPKVRAMTVEDVLVQIRRTRAFITGITVSGGECTLQMDFLKELFREVKKMDLSIFIDTNGSIPLWEDQDFLDLFDRAMVDLKAFEEEEHYMLTGMGNSIVKRNIEFLAQNNKLHEVRTVIVEGLLNNQKNVDKTSRLISALNPEVIYKLIKYRPLGVREGMVNGKTPSNELMKELRILAEGNGCENVMIL